MQGEIQISLSKVIGAVFIALIIGAITGGFTIIRLANTNTIRISANSADIERIEDNFVPRPEWEREIENINNKLDRISRKLDRV